MVYARPAGSRIPRKLFALSRAKGFHLRGKNCYQFAVRQVQRALTYEYISRRLKKRDMRQLWIVRINAATREYQLPYSQFMQGLNRANCLVDRKILSFLAVNEPFSFRCLVEVAKAHLKVGLAAPLQPRNEHVIHNL